MRILLARVLCQSCLFHTSFWTNFVFWSPAIFSTFLVSRTNNSPVTLASTLLWASFSFPLLASVCISSPLLCVFSQILFTPACMPTPLSHTVLRPRHVNTHACTVHTSNPHAHTCTYMTPLHGPGLLLREAPTVVSGTIVTISARGWFLGGDVQVAKKSKGKPAVAPCLHLTMCPGREAGLGGPG